MKWFMFTFQFSFLFSMYLSRRGRFFLQFPSSPYKPTSSLPPIIWYSAKLDWFLCNPSEAHVNLNGVHFVKLTGSTTSMSTMRMMMSIVERHTYCTVYPTTLHLTTLTAPIVNYVRNSHISQTLAIRNDSLSSTSFRLSQRHCKIPPN